MSEFDERPTGEVTLESLRPRVSAGRKLTRMLGLILAVLGLAWAWRTSGIDLGTLVENRERAWVYLVGTKPSDQDVAAVRAEALAAVRTEMQEQAGAAIREEYAARGEVTPGAMQLMRESQERASAELAAMSAEEVDRRVDARVEALLGQGRRGGYIPPVTDPRRIFGDPARHNLPGWFEKLVDGLPAGMAGAASWAYVALNGEGYTGELIETIAIATWGTLLAVVVALPASFLGSARAMRVIATGSSARRKTLRGMVVFWTRRSFDLARGFNEVVMAMIFVAVLGLGPFAGVLALLVHTYGVLGKVFSEAIETADEDPVEGVVATGAKATQVLSIAFVPQILPYVASQSLLRFESNVRGATILGVVGAGGIGQMLMDKFSAYEYREVATMMIIIIVVVTLIDLACGRIMKRFV